MFASLCQRTFKGDVLIEEKPLLEAKKITTTRAAFGAHFGIFDRHQGTRGCIMFEASDGVLPGTDYVLKVVAGPGRREIETHPISTKGRVLHVCMCLGGLVI